MSAPHDRVVVIGAGVVGLACAHALAARGCRVTVIDRSPERRDGCSFGNAGMIVPGHFVPLAALGMVWLGVKWMFDPESPFWIRPRLDHDLFEWPPIPASPWPWPARCGFRSTPTCRPSGSWRRLRLRAAGSASCFAGRPR